MEILSFHRYGPDMTLPLASRFSRLRFLRLVFLHDLDQEYIDGLVAFITAHYAAFPRKKKLQIASMDDLRVIESDPQAGSPESLAERDKARNKGRIGSEVMRLSAIQRR